MAQTIVERFYDRVSGSGDKVALKHRTPSGWKDVTWRQYGDAVKKASKAMIAQGLGHGDKIALLSNNRPEWHIADVAAMSIGGATAAIYTSNSPDQVAYIVEHSESKVAFVDSTDQLEKILKMRGELPNLQKVDRVRREHRRRSQLRHDVGRLPRDRVVRSKTRRSTSCVKWREARRPGDVRLHVGNDRPAQGRDADAREHLVDRYSLRVSTSRSATIRCGFPMGLSTAALCPTCRSATSPSG